MYVSIAIANPEKNVSEFAKNKAQNNQTASAQIFTNNHAITEALKKLHKLKWNHPCKKGFCAYMLSYVELCLHHNGIVAVPINHSDTLCSGPGCKIAAFMTSQNHKTSSRCSQISFLTNKEENRKLARMNSHEIETCLEDQELRDHCDSSGCHDMPKLFYDA